MTDVVIDASAMVDVLLGNDLGHATRARISGHALHAPAHMDAEVLSALGRLHRAGALPAAAVETQIRALASAPIHRHDLTHLLTGAWLIRHQLRLTDALYVELATTLGLRLITTDRRLGVTSAIADVIDAL